MMTSLIDPEAIARDLDAIRAERPLVHSITNHVVMNVTANALLALGASPVMAHAREEVADMARLASALVLNIGTLSPRWVEAMEIALGAARKAGKPVVLDPVGAGATPYRTETAHALLNRGGITVLRGNASEILALAGTGERTRGVDASGDAEARLAVIRELARRHALTVSVSGKVDHVIGQDRHCLVRNGVEALTRITGMGCVASAMTGAFCAVNSDPVAASAHAMAVLGLAGEIAAESSRGPASLQTALLDTLAALDGKTLVERQPPVRGGGVLAIRAEYLARHPSA